MQFEVFAGNPYTGTTMYEIFGSYDWLEEEDLIFNIESEVRDEIETAFHEAAVWYQERGFPPPKLEPIIETDDGPAYRVYVCSYSWEQSIWDAIVSFVGNPGFTIGAIDQMEWSRCGANPDNDNQNAGAYSRDCPQNAGSRTKVIYVNVDAALDENGKLNELGYQTLAHELMHAIMPNTVLGRSDPDCKISGWISEGIPDAIGWDIADDEWKGRYTPSTKDPDIIKRWGYRPYLERLPQTGSVAVPGLPNFPLDARYTSSSFWRYLSDAASPRKWNIMVSAGRPGPPGLLDLPLEGNPGWRSEVDWLDKGLRGKFNLGLRDMYGLFASHFAYSVPPFERYQGSPPESRAVMDHWTSRLFEQCESVNLSSASQQTVNLQIKGLASRCIWVEPTGAPEAIQITFQAGSDDLGLLQDISISRPGTSLLVRASPIGHLPHGPTQYVASWKDFPQDGSERTLYIVSNLANKPSESTAHEITLTVALPKNTNSARGSLPPRKAVPTPRNPVNSKRAKSLSKQRKETQKMINDQMNEDKTSLSEKVSSATRVSRLPNQPQCPQPFVYSACGPSMQISLSLMPGTYIIPGQTTTQGGLAAQAMGGLLAMSQTSMMDTQEVVAELEARIDAIDGSQVSIITPMFDYGFAGSFSNAQISVTMAGGKHLSAFGPPDQSGRTRLTGQVTIEEFTPFVVRGTFVAPLAEFIENPSGGEGIYTRRDTVSGTFSSVAPWQNDGRMQIVYDSMEIMADDIANTLGVPASMIQSMKEDGTMPGSSPSGPGPSTGGSGVIVECTCECEMKPFADELCELLCEEEFAACKSP